MAAKNIHQAAAMKAEADYTAAKCSVDCVELAISTGRRRQYGVLDGAVAVKM